MKFKVEKGSNLHDQLTAIWAESARCNKAAQELADELGAKGIATMGRDIAGGIDAFQFDEKPEGWKVMGEKWQNLYFPKANLKDIRQRIADLPVVKKQQVADILKFSRQAVAVDGGFCMVGLPTITKSGEVFLMDILEKVVWDPVPGAIEILASEFNELKKVK